MPRKALDEQNTIEERIFLPDGRGMRGINLLQSSGPRGNALSVAVHTLTGQRQQINTYSLKNKDFFAQWKRAVDDIAKHYGVEEHSELYARMSAAAVLFCNHYGITLRCVVTTIQLAEFPAREAKNKKEAASDMEEANS